MDNFIFKRFALSLEAPQHASAAIQEHFTLEQTVGDSQFTVHATGFLFTVNTQGNPNATRLAAGNGVHQPLQREVLSSVQDCLTTDIGRVAVHKIFLLGHRHSLFEVHLPEVCPRRPPPPYVNTLRE